MKQRWPSAGASRPPHLCILLAAALGCGGCAVRQPSLRTYRLVQQGDSRILVPPAVKGPTAVPHTFVAAVKAGPGACASSRAVAVRPRGGKIRATVNPALLAAQPPGWLGNWARDLESEDCLAPGEGWNFAEQILQSVPVEQEKTFQLLHANLVDFVPGIEIQVNSPVFRDGAPQDALPLSAAATAENATGLNLTLKTSANLLGYETDQYAVRARPGESGVTIAALSAERHVQGVAEPLAQPSASYFHFPPEARFYRLLYKESASGFTALIVAAASREELDRISGGPDSALASCERVTGGWCAAIPKLVAVNLVVRATVNGKATFARYGATVGESIRGTGERRPEALLPKLSVLRNFHGQPRPVEFDRGSPAILALVLQGGEIISWR